jgi:hypothetical protein
MTRILEKLGIQVTRILAIHFTISPKLKSLQDLSIRVNSEVIEEVMHHAGL